MHDVFVDGGLIRKLWGAESDAYCEHLLRLDPDTRRNRFGGLLPDDTLRRCAESARKGDVIIHGFFVDGVLRGAADLRFLPPPQDREAEAAFSIEKPWQGRGVGSALLARCLLVARNRSVKRVHVCCLADNQRMQRLARKFQAEIAFDSGEVLGRIEAPYPTPLSIMQEAMLDSQTFAIALVFFQSRLIDRSARFFAKAPAPR